MRASLAAAAPLSALLAALLARPAAAEPAAGLALLDSGLPGPTVAVVGGIHGDEASGARAARELASRGPPRRGRLLVLAEANPAALAAGSRAAPGGRDVNRLFPPVPQAREGFPPGRLAPGGRLAPEGSAEPMGRAPESEEARAAAILEALLGADLVLDLHEEGEAWLEADLPTLVLSPAAAGLALEMIEALREAGRPFAFTGGAPAGSLVGELGARGRRAIAVEAPARLVEAERVGLHLAAAEAALGLLGMR